MGAGKSTVASRIARASGLPVIDVDQVLEERLGRPIEQIFAEAGEDAFRSAEEKITVELLELPGDHVIALGGGAIMHERVRRASVHHLVAWIDVDVETAWARVQGSGRPLAADRERFAHLHATRERSYLSAADLVIPSGAAGRIDAALDAARAMPRQTKLLWATSESGDYPAYIGHGLLTQARFWPSEVPGRRFLVTDGNVARLYGELVEPLSGQVVVMPGEQSKTVAHADVVWSELARGGMTRQDLIVALGGGVVGDLAGFCAATYQRGVRYVQVPTTLVAQVDSAYGGKTGVDLPEAKNYVGAYHQPAAVLADTTLLETLAPEELSAGYAEVLKTALIAGGGLWEAVRAGADPITAEIVSACALTKLRIVAADERDAGLRQVLNLGHTVGHAIEAVTGYSRYRHGEAVGLGLLAALRLSDAEELREEVKELLERHGLPTDLAGVDPDAVVMATARDKKRVADGGVPFVLLTAPGHPQAGQLVGSRKLIASVRELTAT